MSVNSACLKGSVPRIRLAHLFVLLVLLVGAFGKAQAAGIALVQHIGKDAGTTTSATLSFAGANTAGNFIAVVIRGGLSNSQVFTVQDSNANTYHQAKQIGSSGSAVTSAIYYAENIRGGANTITVTMTVSGPLRFAILEYSGVATSNSLDVTTAASATSTTPNSGNLTTSTNGDLLLGEVATADSTAFTGGSGFTVRDIVPAPPNAKLITEDQIQATAGIASASATLNPSSNWAALLAAFKPAGGVAGVPASITATAGTPQSATVGTAFTAQFQATVKDSLNNPVGGVTVTFAAPGGGASGTFAGGVTTATTNASGVATSAVFTANTTAGAYIVTASVSGVASPANFSLTNLPGAAASITATAGTPQSATVNTAFATQLQAAVKDSFNNQVTGVTVTFAAPGSGASAAFAGGVNTATTNASGVAVSAVLAANSTAGAYIVTASVSGVASSANFSLTNLAGAAASITATSGTPQIATISTAFATQLQATVRDSSNNPVSGVTVTFSVPGSGASATFAGGVNTATTNASGVATSAVLTANSAAGSYNGTASVSGVASPANFSLTNLAGAAASITATAGTPQSASINTAFATQLQATVKDSGGNPVNGVTVTFTAPGSGASGTFAGGVNTATTNASGVAIAAVFTANSTTGTYTVTASVAGVASPANFSLTNLGNPPANIAATAGTPQSATINTAFAAQLQVTVTDSGNNPVSGVTVTFAVPSTGASVTFPGGVNTAVTNAAGVASSTLIRANSVAGGPYTVSATVSGVASPANFSLTNLAGAVTSVTANAGTPQSATVGAAFATQFQVTVMDSFNNPINGATVTFTAPNSGASGTFAAGVTATTNASGVAIAPVFTANGTAGSYTVTASVPGVASPANFSLTNLAGAAASIMATAGTPQSATVNTPFGTQLQATVKDSFNNPVSGISVAFAAPGSGASGTFAGGVNTATTNASGVATAAVFTANSSAGSYAVTASVSGVATLANFSLTNLPFQPSITSLSPASGPTGTSVTITGTNFGASQGTSTLTFNGAAATPTSWSSTSVVVPVPAGATTGNVVVTVGGISSGGVAFTVTPSIASLSPTSGPVGTSVTITGTNFGATQGTSTVTFSGIAGAPTSWSDTTIVVPAPAGITAGFSSVVVTVGGFASNPVNFKVSPVITSLNPSSGPIGTPFTINGTNFGASMGFNSVTFNGIPVSPTSWSNTSIATSVPSGATTGNVVVTVGTVASNGVSFTVTPSPTITSLSPTSGLAGTVVTISGSNFAATQGSSRVLFNGIAATPTSWSATSIVAPVPVGASTGLVFVDLGGPVSNGMTFTVAPPPPNITSLSSNSGTFGTPVTITGTNFGANQGASFVAFNGSPATPTSWSDTSIAVPVPSTATTGNVTVTVSTGGTGFQSNGVPFSVLPSITSLSSTSGPVGQSIVINGGGFGFAQGANTVSFNGVSATPTSWGPSSIVAPVPSGADTGNVVVTVGGLASNSVPFTVIPSISTLSPASGPVGTSITIAGNGFGPTQGSATITFNGAPMTTTSWSDTSIVAPVPANAVTGNVSVNVGGQASNSVSFTVTPVTITSLSPSSGPVGTSVTITGTNLGLSQGTSVVTFNGVAATPTSWTASGITVQVPAGAASGNVIVTVGGIASNGVLFTVPTTPANIALVQHIGKDAGTTTTTTLAFSSANTAGNLIAVVIRGGNSSAQVFTVSDSNSNTYRQAKQLASSGSAVTSAIYYAENIKGGANTVTVMMSVSGPLRIAILEYSGVATSNSLDAAIAGTTTSISPNSGRVTTTANGDLLLGAVSTADSDTFTAGTGYTVRDIVPAAPNAKLITEDQIQLAAGSASASATLSVSSNWAAILAAFKAASGTGGAGIPASIVVTSGTPQSATVNTAFASQLQATVKDSFNNPVSGVTVTFTAPGSGASVVFSGGVTTAVTNASGVATSVALMANTTAGAYTVTGSVAGVVTPASFSLTNLAGAASSITATAGTPQSATINTAFSIQFQATVKDSFNNPVSPVAVIFNAPLNGASGTFPGGLNTAATNAQGIATAQVFTANSFTGSYVVTASVNGVSSPANFSLTNVSAPPASITATAGAPQSSTVNTAFTTAFQATVKDASNNPVSGVTVTFAAPGTGASGTFAGGVNTATTNSSGVATSAVFTANATAGTYTVTASVAGVGVPASFSLTNVAGAPANIAATAGTPQSAVINTAFAAPLQATVTDSLNNPVSGVTVTFTAPASGASGAFAGGVNTATTNSQGIASASAFTANASVGGPYTVAASASGVAAQASFSLINLSAVGNIALVQHRNMDAGTPLSNFLAFANNTTAGNFIAVCIRGGGSSSQNFTVTDSSGNTYHQAFKKGLVNTVETFGIYYAENIIGGPDTIHVQQSVTASLRFIILEYSGVATSNSLDGTPVTAEGSSATPSTGNLTTTANGDLLLAAMMTKNIAAFTARNGFNIEEAVQASPNSRLIAEDQLQSAAGIVSASASIVSSDNWGAGLAAFRSISGSVAPISVSVSPTAASLPSGYGTQSVSATVNNDFLNRGVTWSLSGAGCSGAACGILSRVTANSVTYTAPANIPSPSAVTLTATSIGDTTKSASATITVTQGVLTVVLNPKRAAVTMASSPVQFGANVYNDPRSLGVTWQVDGNNGGTAASGTISATGLYTPGIQPGAHTVTAVSNANASVSGSALIAVTDLAGVYTHHNDNARTGQNLQEYGLTSSTVNPASFGQLFSCPVDGNIYAQPLWVANLNFSGSTRNVVFIATEHDSVYAFDADSPSCVQLWKSSFLSSGVTTLTPADVASNNDFYPEIGITSTPVIDPATNTLYVVPKTRETVGTVNGQACSAGTPCYVHRLHALDLFTGAEKFGGPVVITAANFNSQKHLQRPALLLANNTLYLGFGSHGDQCPYQGWVMGYNPSTLAQTFAKALSNPTTCNQGAIWMSGGGPSADASGNIFVVTANGLYDGTSNFGDTVAKLSPTGSLLDWFTPFNQATLAANDVDLGSSAVLILPDSVGSAAHPHLAVTMGKTAVVYLIDQANMGKFNSSGSNDVQEVIPVPPMNTTMDDGGNYVGPAYWNGNIYVTGQNYPLSQFQISNGVIATPQFAVSSNMFPPRGGAPVVSANGASGGVLWIIDYTGFQNNTAAILYAYDANNVVTMLYSSPASGSGAAGNGVKFTVPTVANGKVYVGGQLSFTVYGLLPN